MKLSGNSILITGGASGIGLAFAERFLKLGNEVLICGRREQKLAEAKQKYPQLKTKLCDVSKESDRIGLYEWCKREFPNLNVIVNNAGIQQRIDLLNLDKDWDDYRQELIINIEAPMHLSVLFLPILKTKDNAAILNVTSGLAFTPMAVAPIYCATKAAMHSFTVSLRYQVAKENIEVIEIAPPAVNTDLGGPGLHTFGEPLAEFADGIFEGLKCGDSEIGYGTSAKALRMSRDEIDQTVKFMNSRR